jgi:hypothetical protein
MLGLAVGERVALVAEVSSAGGRPAVQRVGEFHYPTGFDLSQPDSIGRALGLFLREQGFTARSVVVGLPGKWVLSKRAEAPAAEPQLVADSLRLQAEAEFAADGGEFAYDYAGASSPAGPGVGVGGFASRAADGRPAARARADEIPGGGGEPDGRRGHAVRGDLGGRLAPRRQGRASAAVRTGRRGVRRPERRGLPEPAALPRPVDVAAGAARRRAPPRVRRRGPPPHAPSGNGAAAGAGGELLLWNDARLEPAAVEVFGGTLGSAVRVGQARRWAW